MPSIKRRIEWLEAKVGTLVDGRDPGLVEMYEIVAKSEARPFDINEVPQGVTVRDLLKEIDGKSRGLPSRGADVIGRRTHGKS